MPKSRWSACESRRWQLKNYYRSEFERAESRQLCSQVHQLANFAAKFTAFSRHLHQQHSICIRTALVRDRADLHKGGSFILDWTKQFVARLRLCRLLLLLVVFVLTFVLVFVCVFIFVFLVVNLYIHVLRLGLRRRSFCWLARIVAISKRDLRLFHLLPVYLY